MPSAPRRSMRAVVTICATLDTWRVLPLQRVVARPRGAIISRLHKSSWPRRIAPWQLPSARCRDRALLARLSRAKTQHRCASHPNPRPRRAAAAQGPRRGRAGAAQGPRREGQPSARERGSVACAVGYARTWPPFLTPMPSIDEWRSCGSKMGQDPVSWRAESATEGAEESAGSPVCCRGATRRTQARRGALPRTRRPRRAVRHTGRGQLAPQRCRAAHPHLADVAVLDGLCRVVLARRRLVGASAAHRVLCCCFWMRAAGELLLCAAGQGAKVAMRALARTACEVWRGCSDDDGASTLHGVS